MPDPWDSPEGQTQSFEEQLADVVEALDWAKAPTMSTATIELSPAGRVRALYSRERIDANQQRGRARELGEALRLVRPLLDKITLEPGNSIEHIKDQVDKALGP